MRRSDRDAVAGIQHTIGSHEFKRIQFHLAIEFENIFRVLATAFLHVQQIMEELDICDYTLSTVSQKLCVFK